MKKLVSVLIALILALTVSLSVLAAPNGFVESPSNQTGPELIGGDNIVLTPFGDKDKLPDDVRDTLEDSYNSILNADNLGEICEALEELAKQVGVPVENLVVSELFELSYESGKEDNDGKYVVTLKDDTFEDFFALMKYEDGKWVLVDDAKTSDGNKLTFTAGELPSPFAVVINPNGGSGGDDSVVPPTGDSNNIFGVAVAGGVALATLTGVYFVFKKREEE